MNVEAVRDYCIHLPYVKEGTPFGADVLVYKLHAKIFALISLKRPFRLSLKCEPERALYLREHYTHIVPGYHLNKKHWNTVGLEANLSADLIIEMIDHSYQLILKSLPKKYKQ